MPGAEAEILDIAHDAFVGLDARGRVVYWNPRAEHVFGLTREQALGTELGECVLPERHREHHRAGLRRFVDAGDRGALSRRINLEALRSDGSEFPIEMTLTAVRSGAEWTFFACIEDVSERTELLGRLESLLREGNPGLAEIFDSLAEAVTIRDPQHHVIYANRAALDSMGFSSLHDMQRRALTSIFDDYVVQDEHGRDLSMADIPSVRLLSGQSAEPLVMRTVNRATGEATWRVLKTAPLRDQAGHAVAAVTIIEDITAEKTAELRDRFLARATETLMSSLDHEETLGNVAWLMVPEVADWCAVDLLDERGERQHVAVAHVDPEKLALADELRRLDGVRLDPNRGLGKVLRTGVGELYPEVPDELLAAAAVSEDHLRLLRQVGLRSALIAPLKVRGRTLGAMTLVNAESPRRFDQDDLEFAEAVAARAAMAVDNARLATARREIAETLQRSLLPERVPSIDGWDVATLYRAAGGGQEVEVGGDFYDFFCTEEGWVVLLGDVTGKGVEAASLTSLVRHGARFLSKYERSPAAILDGIDQELRRQHGLWLCSALCLRLHADHVLVSSAGHPAPLLVHADGESREMGTRGAILGAWPGGVWSDRVVRLGEDDTLFLYTDGVTDTVGANGRFGIRRLRRVLAGHAGRSSRELLAGLEQALDQFQVEEQTDDTAALALRLSPARERAGMTIGAQRPDSV